MTRVILDIPTEKMRSFIRLLRELGIDRGIVRSHGRTNTNNGSVLHSREKNLLKKIYRSYLLFDWEFFSNELEFE